MARNEMELYAEPIPPLAGKPQVSRANFREVVLKRLTAVQEQKKSLNISPLRIASAQTEQWRNEKDILVEMLEKTQKLQLACQQSWSQEREDLEKQLKRADAQYRSQVETLKQDNDRLRTELARAKTIEEDFGARAQLTAQLQESAHRHQEREESLLNQVKALETALGQYKEGLDKATEELEKKRFLADEQSVLQEAKAEETISALRREVAQSQSALRDRDESIRSMSQELAQARSQLESLRKKKAGKVVTTQTDLKAEEIAKLCAAAEDCRKDVSVIRAQKDSELTAAKEENTRLAQSLLAANAALRAQSVIAQSVQSSALRQDTQTRVMESLRQLREARENCMEAQVTELRGILSSQEWADTGKLVTEFKGWLAEVGKQCGTMADAKLAEIEERTKALMELYAGSLKALLETARTATDVQNAVLENDNEKLRKERDTLLVALQGLKTKTLEPQAEALSALVKRVEAAAAAVRTVEATCAAIKEKCLQTCDSLLASLSDSGERREQEAAAEAAFFSQVDTFITRLEAASPGRTDLIQQKDKLEKALAKLKEIHDRELEALTTQYDSLQALVQTERGRLCDNLLKIAESVEYRQEIWEQLQTAEDGGSDLREELDRQSQWEIETLAVLMTRLQDPLQPDVIVDVNEIKEEEEEEDEEEDARVVIKLK